MHDLLLASAMRTGDSSHFLLVLLAVVAAPIASLHQKLKPSSTMCSASTRTRLDPLPLSTQEQELYRQMLPQPTSNQPVVRGELRAPFHIPCQLASFSYLQEFADKVYYYHFRDFETKEFAQPPHLIFFDEHQNVVQTIVVSPSWTEFELRDLVYESLGG